MNYLYIHINHNFVVRVPTIISILVEYHLFLQRLIKFIDNLSYTSENKKTYHY